MTTCKNCNIDSTGTFCPKCGTILIPRRINGQYIASEISSIFNFDKGIFYTIRELLIRPGHAIRGFIHGDRKKIVKPIYFLIISSLVYTLAQHYFNFEARLISYEQKDLEETPIMVQVFEWFSNNYGYANILIVIFISMWVKLFFRKYEYNFYEIYILMCFVLGLSILIQTLIGLIDSIFGIDIIQLGVITNLIYSTWAIGRFFGREKRMNYFKGFWSYSLGMITSLVVFFVIGFGLDRLF